MNYLVLLDAGPLGLVTNPRESDETKRCGEWLRSLLAAGVRVMVPEGADFEVRRELIRAGRPKGIARLDDLAEQIGYLPITTPTYRRAAELWAWLRNEGLQAADPKELDFDVILGAQWRLAREDGHAVVATTNVGHLGRLCDARSWDRIGTDPVDFTEMAGLRFQGVTIREIIDQYVDVVVRASSDGDPAKVKTLCRTFVRGGDLWVDFEPDDPDLRMRHVTPVPAGAMVVRNDVELSLGRFAIVVDRASGAGQMVEAAIRARDSRG